MQEIAIKTQNKIQSASALAPSLELELAAVQNGGAWNLREAQARLTEPVRDALTKERDRLAWLLYRAHPDEIKVFLGKLVLHFPQTNMDDGHLSMLYEDYIQDLQQYPAHLLEAACREYRRNVENRFFPKVSELIALVNPKWLELKSKLATIEKILSGRTEKPKSEPITDDMWQSLKSSLKKYERVGA